MATLFFNPWPSPQSSAGSTLPGAKLNFYKTGTTTRQNTFTDSALSVAHANPVVADANGRFAPIYLSETLGDYKIVFTDADDVEIDTVDPYIFNAGNVAPVEKAANFTTTGAENGKIISVTGAATISLGDADTMGSTYSVTVKNVHSAPITVNLDTATDTLDGVANDSLLVEPQSAISFHVNTDEDGFLSVSEFLRPGKAADIASAAELPYSSRLFADVTGTTTITSLATSGRVGTRIVRQFDGVLTITHHATNLILPGGSNIITQAGDVAEFLEYASGDWLLVNYMRASGVPGIVQQTVQASTSGTEIDFTGIPTAVNRVTISLLDVSFATADVLMVRIGAGGSVETGGYDSSAAWLDSAAASDVISTTAAFRLAVGTTNVAQEFFGTVTLTRLDPDNDVWTATAIIGDSSYSPTRVSVMAGRKTLTGGDLDRVRIYGLSGNAFDNGSINVTYEL